MVSDRDFDEVKIQYLNMIHAIISRMGTITPAIKGLAIALLVAMPSFVPKLDDPYRCFLFVGIGAMTAGFLCLDMYYLMLEKRYRELYEHVRQGKHDVDFDLSLPKTKSKKFPGGFSKVSFVSGLKSPSIWIFYSVLIITMICIMAATQGGGNGTQDVYIV